MPSAARILTTSPSSLQRAAPVSASEATCTSPEGRSSTSLLVLARLLPLTIVPRCDDHPKGHKRWLPFRQFARVTAFAATPCLGHDCLGSEPVFGPNFGECYAHSRRYACGP